MMSSQRMISSTILCLLLTLLYYFPLQMLTAGIAGFLYSLVSSWMYYAKVKCYDDSLFKDPPEVEDCPICFLPLPYMDTGIKYQSCCGKIICSGCTAAFMRMDDNGIGICPFCRTPVAASGIELFQRVMKRMVNGDAEATFGVGNHYHKGEHGLPQDREKALELWHKAADRGHAGAYFSIGLSYFNGDGVQQDVMMAVHYWELAAMRGDVMARQNLGIYEESIGNIDRAMKHYQIAAKCGCEKTLNVVQDCFKNGLVAKEVYANVLRARQQYVQEISSDERDKAAVFREDFRYK